MNRVNNKLVKMTFSAFFLALAFVLPFLTGQIPEVGSMLCPMHLPVLLAGFLCGPWWAAAVGAVAAWVICFGCGIVNIFEKSFEKIRERT